MRAILTMSLKPGLTDLMLAVDSLEEVKDQLFDKPALAEWEMACEREVMRVLAIFRAHVNTLNKIGYG